MFLLRLALVGAAVLAAKTAATHPALADARTHFADSVLRNTLSEYQSADTARAESVHQVACAAHMLKAKANKGWDDAASAAAFAQSGAFMAGIATRATKRSLAEKVDRFRETVASWPANAA